MTDTKHPRRVALLPAAGTGSRAGLAQPKQYEPLAGRPLMAHAIGRLARHPRIDLAAVVIAASDAWFDRYPWQVWAPGLVVLRCGGATRAETVLNGLRALAQRVDPDDWVLVHDAARPCLSNALIDRLLDELGEDPVGGIAALPVADTLKRAGTDDRIDATVSRETLWQAQTPQMFRHAVLREALERSDPERVTDEASAIEAAGLRPRLVPGDAANLKVTYPGDLELAARLLAACGAPTPKDDT